MAQPQLLHVKIISPKEVLFDGPAVSVSSKNSAGNFDILFGHANFITFIDNYPVTVRKPDQTIAAFHFPMAIIYNTNNNVYIYTDIHLQLEEQNSGQPNI